MRNQGSYGVGRGDPRACLRRVETWGLHPCSLCSWRGKPDFWNVFVEMQEVPPVGLCVRWGQAGPGILRSKGPVPGAWLPPDPRFLGFRSPDLGYGIHAGECSPSNGLNLVRKEINKKGWEGGWGVRTAWAIQSRPRAQAMEVGRIQATPGQESESFSGWDPDIGA